MLSPNVLAVVDRLETFQKGRANAWNVPRDEALFLYQLALWGGCRFLVEVGTSYGFSGLFLAAATRAAGGRLHTFDIDPEKHDHARGVFREAGLGDTVTLHTGDAKALLPALEAGIDFAFLDAAKHETAAYWAAIEPKLAPRAIVVLDNTSTHPEEMADVVDLLRGRADFTSGHVPFSHGVEVAVRVP